MDLSCSNEKFNLMNSLLDKELETLKNFGGTKSSKLGILRIFPLIFSDFFPFEKI